VDVLRALVADDHPLMPAAIRRVFGRRDDFEVVGEVTRGSQVLPAVASSQPDVLLLDVHMPELEGIGCLQRLRRQGAASSTSQAARRAVRWAFRHGVVNTSHTAAAS